MEVGSSHLLLGLQPSGGPSPRRGVAVPAPALLGSGSATGRGLPSARVGLSMSLQRSSLCARPAGGEGRGGGSRLLVQTCTALPREEAGKVPGQVCSVEGRRGEALQEEAELRGGCVPQHQTAQLRGQVGASPLRKAGRLARWTQDPRLVANGSGEAGVTGAAEFELPPLRRAQVLGDCVETLPGALKLLASRPHQGLDSLAWSPFLSGSW